MKKPEKQPAFPAIHAPLGCYIEQGMTLRDYFAAKAMQAIVSREACTNRESNSIPSDAYMIADAMLKARES